MYILTNPSFKANRVKIGFTDCMEERLRTLNNTSLPYPFEVFATLQTAKYREVEKLIHKIMDLLTKRRINKKREFFDINPHKVLEIFEHIKPITNDAVIVIPNLSSSHRTSHKRSRFKFSMAGIKPGKSVTFDPTGVKVKVLDDDKIEYKGKSYKLSSFTRDFMPKDMRNSSGAYQGPKYFSYKGKILDDLRAEAGK